MVGKAQRTKNNVKASNSGRSAQLLANLPNTSFIGFSTLKDAALHTTPDLFDDTISSDFQIILKKMNKKDSVTKHKALHEFADLCNSSEIDTLKSVLPLWPRLYSILSIDIENRVREATQYAHKCMVTRVKRNIAPHLKHLIGPWIVSQFDTYPPAASVAKTSFEDAFPPLKRTEVFAFCKDDLFNYIIDNLIVQTPQTMSNPKITDAVNMEMKYERVISSTLQAYALFISKLPPDTLTASLQDHTSNVLSTAKFWKYQKHESNLIRSSWYLLVATLIEKCPQVFENDLKKIAVAIFSNLNEKDVKVNANVWDAALYCVLRYESDLWKCISVEKLVVPNVCSTLENGFHGNGSQIAPKLLPLLSKLPSNEDQPLSQLNIYEKILSSLLLNITLTSVKNNSTGQMSSSEFDAVLKCFTECCRYILKTESKTLISADLCRKVVLDYVLSLYRIAASHVEFSLTVRYLYQLELESALIDILWERLASGLVEGESKEGLEKELCLHASLVQSLWNPYAARKCGGGMKVKFQDKQGGDEEDLGAKISEVKNNLDSPCEGFTIHIHAFITTLLQHYLSHLNSLPHPSTSKALERSLIQHICKLSSSLDSKFIYDLLPLPSAFNHWGLIAGDSIYELMCKYIAKLNIDHRESNKILEQVACNQTMPLFTWCLRNMNKYGAIVSPWLKDERLQDTLLSIVYQVTVGSESHTELLEKCFIRRPAQDPIGDQKSNERDSTVELNESNSKNCQSRQVLSIIVNSLIADRIFLQFLDVFRQFGDNSSEDKIDYENCARVVTQFLKVEDVVARHKKLIEELLVCLVQAIMRSRETTQMLLCWEAALVCTQPNTSTRRDIWRTIHCLCVETLLAESAPKAETSNENENILLGKQIIEKSVLILSELMVEPEMNWDTIFRPSPEIESARAHWRVYDSMHEGVWTCEEPYELAPVREWNLQECEHIQIVYWNLHVYAQLTLNLLQTQYLSQEFVNEEDLNKESENLINLSESLTDFLIEYFQYTIFAEQYLPTKKTCDTNELFSRVWTCCRQAFIQRAQSLDIEKNGYLRSIECLREHLMEEKTQVDVGHVVASSEDVMKLVLNTLPLQSPITRDSFIKYVRDHSNDPFESHDVFSLVEVFTKLLSLVNKKEAESEYVESIVDTIRGEIMLMLTSHLVHYYSHVTSRSAEEKQTPLETRLLILAAHLLRCYQQIDEYCRERSGTEFSVEWNSVFADDCKDVIANIWVWTASMNSLVKTAADLHLLNILCSTLCSSPAPFSTLDTLCPLLLASSRAVQVTAYEVIRRCDVIESYDVIASTLTSAQTVVDALLQNFSLGDTCIVLGGTDSYTYSLGYLLTWLLIVHRCDVAESRHADVTDVALWLKSNGYLDALLRSLLELMPEAIVHGGACATNVQQLFLAPKPPTISEVWSSGRLSELACGVYYRVLRRFPALARAWWHEGCSPSEATLVEKLTSRYVSPLLCAEELRTAAKFTQENMQIRVFPGTKEVVATYTLEEASMEITITLPSNHPLGVIRVDSLKNLFPNTQWIKQITKFLIHANGTICDGLTSWKSNMDKKFDGVEECYICFCILHSRNHELPRKSCRTCQKKFHSYCLFKWFTTSNKSTCPICRNLF